MELTLIYTYKPNGGSERVGQEAITKLIKIRDNAQLPKHLWPETVLAAIYLYNKSPSYAYEIRTLDKVLDFWFRQYF